jgi:hypothetical protein
MSMNATAKAALAACLLAVLLAGLAACRPHADPCTDAGNGYVDCHDSGVLHTEAERARLPVQDLTLIDLYWEIRASGERQRDVEGEYRRALEWKSQHLAGADAARKQQEVERLQAEWGPRLSAARARGDALGAEMHRRCPGGASLNPTTQSCSMKRPP